MHLQKNERLHIIRRKRHETQREAAGRYGISTRRYINWELGIVEIDISVPQPKLFPNEKCFIHRMRQGWTQQQTATRIGCCKNWVGMMERNEVPCDLLLRFWT